MERGEDGVTFVVELPPLAQVGAVRGLRRVGAYPNPFDGFTAFSYPLTKPADEVAIRIYTFTGRLVRGRQ